MFRQTYSVVYLAKTGHPDPMQLNDTVWHLEPLQGQDTVRFTTCNSPNVACKRLPMEQCRPVEYACFAMADY